MKFVLASKNQKKLVEMNAILSQLGIEVCSEADAGVDVEVEETGSTFEENSLLKARAVMEASGRPAVADDSGLCVDALNGAPGVYSARYGGPELDDTGRCRLLLENLRGQSPRTAKFVSVITCCFPNGDVLTARGECPGTIAFAPIFIDAQAQDITHGPIDAAGNIMCTYPGAVATLHYSKFTQDFSPVQIEGERGTITLDSISMPSHMRIDMMGVAVRMAARTRASSGSTEEMDLPQTDNSMCYELADFIHAVEQVQAGTPAFEAACGAHGTMAHFRDLTLATMDVMDPGSCTGGHRLSRRSHGNPSLNASTHRLRRRDHP